MSKKFAYLLKKSFTFRFFIFCFIFALISVSAFVIKLLLIKAPVINTLNPIIAESSDNVIISGYNFGNQFSDSWIEIGETIIQSDDCSIWTDNQIEFKYPEYQPVGILYIVINGKKSNPFFISSKKLIPKVKNTFTASGTPSIDSISKTFAEVGNSITLYGSNFGKIRDESQVIFIQSSDASYISKIEENENIHAVYCSDYDFDFISWSNEEITVRVPDGADSGMIVIKTKMGISNPVSFKLKNKLGVKTHVNKKQFILEAETDITEIKAEKHNSLFIKMPIPIKTYSQNNTKILAIHPAPFVKDYQGAVIHQYKDVSENTRINIRQEYSVDSYEIRTKINFTNLKYTDVKNKAVYNAYSFPSELLPSDNSIIKNKCEEIIKNEKNPYLKVKKIYDYFLNNIEIIPASVFNSGNSPVNALNEKKTDTYDTAILFATLARAAGVPAQPISGIVVDVNQNSFVHWWNEFYLDGFGWIPVDISMARGIPFDMGIPKKEEWYFGNLDAFRVIFSRGRTAQTPMTPNGKNKNYNRSYALNQSWEEFQGLISYNSNWKIPKIIAIY